MANAPHVTVVGGGLVGLTTALFLDELGASVRLIDHGPLGGGASRGNAGLVCSAIVAPLAGPGAVLNAIKSLPKADTPLRLHPAQLPRQLSWFARFALSCTAKKYTAAQLALGRLNAASALQIERIRKAGARVDLGPELVAPFHDPKIAEHFFHTIQPLAQLGVAMPDRILDGDETRALVPALTDYVTAGIRLPGERMVNPGDVVDSLIEVLSTRPGVELLADHRITGFDHTGGRVTAVTTAQGRFETDQVVLCAGAGIQRLGKMLGVSIPVIPGQGYNVVVPSTPNLQHPVITDEAHAVATPLANGIRVGGTMEFGGEQPRFDQRRVDAIIRSTRRFIDLDWDRANRPWAGCRPMSPDGLPLIGRPDGFSNLVIAGGHGMYGLTLAPATANAVSQLVVDGRCDTDLRAFDPNRF